MVRKSRSIDEVGAGMDNESGEISETAGAFHEVAVSDVSGGGNSDGDAD